jgi:hypothetical protein
MKHIETSMPFEYLCLESPTLFEPLEVDHTNDNIMASRESSRLELEGENGPEFRSEEKRFEQKYVQPV